MYVILECYQWAVARTSVCYLPVKGHHYTCMFNMNYMLRKHAWFMINNQINIKYSDRKSITLPILQHTDICCYHLLLNIILLVKHMCTSRVLWSSWSYLLRNYHNKRELLKKHLNLCALIAAGGRLLTLVFVLSSCRLLFVVKPVTMMANGP